MASLLIIGIVGEFFILDFFLFHYERLTWWGEKLDNAAVSAHYGITYPLLIGAIGCIVLSLIGGIGIRNYFRNNI